MKNVSFYYLIRKFIFMQVILHKKVLKKVEKFPKYVKEDVYEITDTECYLELKTI